MTLYQESVAMDDRNCQRIILSLASSRGDAGFTAEEATELAEWADGVCLEYELLDMVLNGDILIDLKDGEPTFVSASEEQTAEVKALFEYAGT